jgi:hypothetical protein
MLCTSSVKDYLMTDGCWWPVTGTYSRNAGPPIPSLTRPSRQLTTVRRPHGHEVAKPGGPGNPAGTAWGIGAGR